MNKEHYLYRTIIDITFLDIPNLISKDLVEFLKVFLMPQINYFKVGPRGIYINKFDNFTLKLRI